MTERAAIVIVGGGPAGLTTALATLRADPRLEGDLVVLEKERYPRDKYCAGALGGRGERILEALDASPSVPSAPLAGMSFRGREGEQAARVGSIGRVVRRLEWDHALAELARARGVRLVEGAGAERVDVGGDRATVVTPRGSFEGRIVVGADGVGSVVRRAMGLGKGALRAQVLEVDTEPVAGDRPRDLAHFDASDRSLAGYFWDFPTLVGGRELVCRGIYQLREAPGVPAPDGRDVRARLAARLAEMGLSIEACKEKRFAERGLRAGEALARAPLLLVGEAAGIDPVTGEGIAQAIEYGALAGPFLVAALRGDRPLEAWSSRVARSRLGLDLRLRARVTRTFFGDNRGAVERALVASPAAVRSGARHFGGLAQDRADLTRVAASVAGIFLESRARTLARACRRAFSSSSAQRKGAGQPRERLRGAGGGVP